MCQSVGNIEAGGKSCNPLNRSLPSAYCYRFAAPRRKSVSANILSQKAGNFYSEIALLRFPARRVAECPLRAARRGGCGTLTARSAPQPRPGRPVGHALLQHRRPEPAGRSLLPAAPETLAPRLKPWTPVAWAAAPNLPAVRLHAGTGTTPQSRKARRKAEKRSPSSGWARPYSTVASR